MDTALVINEKQDLQDVWPQVVAEYEQVTGKKLDSNTNFDALTQQIEKDLRKSQSRNGVRARKIIGNVGKCLKQFGGIISQAASVAFGPSTQCWNAISFVISAAQSYREVLDGFLALMEHALAFLNRLNFFLEQRKTGAYLDPHLRGPAYAILSHFLNLLKCSHDLATRKREKFKLVLNIVLFNGDAGVSASLKQMEALVLSFTHAEIDQILVDVKGLAAYMHESADITQQRHGELKEYFERTEGLIESTAEGVQNISKRLDSRFLMEQLSVDLKNIREAYQLEKSPQKWESRQYAICGSWVKGTSTWLLGPGDTPFHKWADITNLDADKTMIICGESGFGKSYLFGRVVAYLEDHHRAQGRTYVLYYYYGELNKTESARRCLAAMIYQLAALDETGKFATRIAEACKQFAKDTTAEDLWNLFVSTLQSTIPKGKCFLCIDGCPSREDLMSAELFAKMVKQASLSQKDVAGFSLRILLTGTPDDISSIVVGEEDSIFWAPLGPLGPSSDAAEGSGGASETFANESDLLIVAKSRVSALRPEISTLLTAADIQDIVTGVRGHYEHLESKLKQIRACTCIEDVREVVNRAEEGFESTTQNSILSLNDSLTPEAIIQLNGILAWLKGCRSWRTLELLQSVLAFTLGKTLFLETMIRTKFSTLLTIDAYSHVTAPDGLREMLSTLGLDKSEAPVPELIAVSLDTAEVELCRRFIRNACDPLDFKRFGFDGFFDALAGKQESKIHIDCDEVLEITLLQTCIRSLTEYQNDGRFLPLREYASFWFYEHLITVVENLETFDYEKSTLRAIGASLARLLQDDAAIDAWWSNDHLYTLRVDWFHRDDVPTVKALGEFVRHRSVAQGYDGIAPEGSFSGKSKAAAELDGYSLLQKVASRLATRWFRRSLVNDENFWIAFTIVAKQAGGSYDGMSAPSGDEIATFSKWARDNAQSSVDEQLWKFREGSTYFTCGHRAEGYAAMKQAQEDGYSDWALSLRLAEEHCKDNEFEAALGYCRKFAELKSVTMGSPVTYSDGSTHDVYIEAYYGRVLLREAECYKNLNSPNDAIRCYMEVLGYDDTYGDAHEEALSNLFGVWRESKEYSSTIDLLRAWRDTSEEGLFHWITKIAKLESVHLCLLDAARSTASHDEVIDAYRLALQSLLPGRFELNDDEKQLSNLLRYFLAIMLFYGSPLHEHHHEALDIWEDLIVNQNGALNCWSVSVDSARKLFRSLCEKASVALTAHDCEYTTRLTRLAAMDHEDIQIFRQCGKDPRLSLARIQHTRGCAEEARRTLRDRVRNAVDGWGGEEDDEKIATRYGCLAHALVAIRDDVNAIAVWQATKPKTKDTPTVDGEVSENQAMSGAEASQPPSTSPDDAAHNPGEVTIGQTDDQEGQVRKREPYFNTYYCDGSCGNEFDVSSDAYICRDCLDVQFCSKCHAKLMDGQISPTICSSSHDFLYVPPAEQELWERMSDDQVIVGGVLVSRDAWIDGVRREWDLMQEQIDTEKLEAARKLKAARCVATFIVNWKRGQRKKSAVMASKEAR